MNPTCVIIHYGGRWTDDKYDGGEKRLLPVPADGISYESLLSKIQMMVDADKNDFTFSISSIVQSPEDDILRMNVMTDFDLQFLMDNCKVPKLFITITPTSSHSSYGVLKQSGVLEQGFVNLLNAQTPFPHTTDIGNRPITSHVVPSGNLGQFSTQSCHVNSDDGGKQASNEVLHDWGVAADYMDKHVDESDDGVDYDSFNESDENIDYDSLDDVHVEKTGVVGHLDINHDEILQDKGSTSSSREWVIPGALYNASVLEDNPKKFIQYTRDSLAVGALYPSKESLKIAVGLFHLLNRVEYVVDRSSRKRYSVTCRHNCEFMLTAYKCGSYWRVTTFSIPHTCQLDLRRHSNRTLSALTIGAFFAPDLVDEKTVLKPNEMMSKLQREYGFHVDYNVALAGRDHAIRMRFGDPDKSFQRLPSYLYMVQQSNPGSIVSLTTDGEERFQYVFIALSACVSGFLSSSRQVIVVDGTHLKGRYRGIMFVAATQDGNEQLFPLAFGVGDKESDISWTWFLEQLKKTFGCPPDLVFVSDQHRSIHNAVKAVYPGVPHCLCMVHLQKNLTKNVAALFQNAVYSYKNEEFDNYMNSLALVSAKTYKKLMEIGPCRWSRSKSKIARYDFLTSNCAEAVNSRLRWARKLPVCSMLESVRTILGKWFAERRAKALARVHELTSYAASVLEKSIREGETMAVEAINISKFKVSFQGRDYVVDLNAKSCSCRRFDLDLIPCSHAAAAICKNNHSYVSYVSSYYTMESLRDMYRGEVNPIPHPDEWCIPTEVASKIVSAPSNPRQAGRPCTKRIQSRRESSSSSGRRACTRCKRTGHYRSTCTLLIPNPQVEYAESSQSGCRKRSASSHKSTNPKRKCSDV